VPNSPATAKITRLAVAKALNAQMRLLSAYHPIVIILDRERRAERCHDLIQELSGLLDGHNHHGRYVVGMADRTIENWILADWQFIVQENPSYQSLPDGVEIEHGKSIVKRLMPKEIYYHETTIGVELFLKCRPHKMYEANESFRSFVSQLNLQCWWLREIHARFCPPWSG
jgi:hypothetical protein